MLTIAVAVYFGKLMQMEDRIVKSITKTEEPDIPLNNIDRTMKIVFCFNVCFGITRNNSELLEITRNILICYGNCHNCIINGTRSILQLLKESPN